MNRYRGRLIILAILILILALVAFLLTRRGTREIAGAASFSFVTSIYGFTTPMGVATDDDENLWVTNISKSEVLRYDRNGIELGRIETNDEQGQPLQFESPYGIVYDEENDKLYVADYNWHGVRVFDHDSNFLYNVPRDPEPFGNIAFTPYDVDTMGDKVYVIAREGLFIFDSEGNYITRWGQEGSEIGNFSYPNGVATDPASRTIYVTDSNNRRLVAFNESGQVKWVLGNDDPTVTTTSVFLLPHLGLDVAPNGHVYLTDVHSHKIYVIDSSGKLLSVFGNRGTADSQFNFPEGIVITSTNRMYVADRENNRVQIWQLSEDLPKPEADKVAEFDKALSVVTPAAAAPGAAASTAAAAPAGAGAPGEAPR